MKANGGKPMYVVVAPKMLRLNTDYHISVSLYDMPAPIEVNATVSGWGHSVSTGAVTVGTAESKVLTLAIGDWPRGYYQMHVMGTGANFTKHDVIDDKKPLHWGRDDGRSTVAITTNIFKNQLMLTFMEKCVSVFIQTDKAVYKPGQKVLFRAVVVNPSLIPKDNIPIDIYIEDGNGKRVNEWKQLNAKNGVISEELQLSAQPVLGHWTIGVTALRHNTTKTFIVTDDVLPTFDVEVVLPTYVTRNRPEMVALVKAFDTNGKAVKGELTLYIANKDHNNPRILRAKETIDGSATLNIDLIDDLQIDNSFHLDESGLEIDFTVRVRDALTGKQLTRHKTVMLYERDLKIEVVKTSMAYKPGLKNTFVVKVGTQDGKPVPDSGPQLNIKYGYSWDKTDWKECKESPLLVTPINGLIKFDVFPPKDIERMGVKAEYMGQTYDIAITKAKTRCGQYLQVVRADTTDITVGQDVKFVVNATEPIIRLVCEVMGRGDIAWAKSFDIHTNINAGYEFTVPTLPQMAPLARLLCHYVRPDDQEVVADALDFDVEPVFRTPVQTVDTKPEELAGVGLNTRHNPFVDISREEVMNELKAYDTDSESYHSRRWSRHWSATVNIFDDSGVGMMHNGVNVIILVSDVYKERL
ncbi:unnamed protein product [Medioppia subpectinata]|uniref:TEP1-F n=1 Tax=Medioppia subpectinata TaxID=1979941 RepID=A0A7R9KRW0_9ACAR|nr:unnamed protein product [Medioppia subpectinata]CAG2108674.1 unnamed protein product [Medioppia subpectinata]